MLKSIINIIFPQYCLFCGRQGDLLCSYCRRKLIPSLPECYICRRLSKGYKTHEKCRKPFSLDSVFYGWQYNSNSSKLIKTLKYKGAYNISNEIAELLCQRIISTGFINQFNNPILIPIPLHRMKKMERGFNQSEILCENISKILKINQRKDILVRNFYDKPQAEKDKTKRESILKETFSFDLEKFKGEDIVLVDDVITTGSTLYTACRAIKMKNKNIKVSAVCVLRGKPYYSPESSEELKSDIFFRTSS
jgi:competence protein ComFC